MTKFRIYAMIIGTRNNRVSIFDGNLHIVKVLPKHYIKKEQIFAIFMTNF